MLPEIADDIEIEPVAAAANSDDTDDGAPENAGPAQSDKADRRNDIVRRFLERRKQQEVTADVEPDAVAVADDASDEVEDETETAPIEAAPVNAPAKVEDAEPEFTLLVDGKLVKMKQSEVLAKAQIAVASDNRLDEAKRLLQEARVLRGQDATSQHQRDGDDDLNGQDDEAPVDAKATNQPSKLDREKLRGIVQRLQIGDEDEGVDALSEVVSLLAADSRPGVTREDIEREIAQSRLKSEMTAAGEAFQEKHAAIMGDQELREIAYGRIRGEVRADLASLGIDAQQLAGLNGEQLFTLHMNARAQGAKVRSYDKLFEKAGADVSTRYGALIQPAADPQPTQQTQQPTQSRDVAQTRIDRKRSASQQPRTAGMRQAPPPQQQAKSRAEIIADMARARGFQRP